MKKRLILADKTFNTEVSYNDKTQRWEAEKTYKETDFFLTEEQAQAWIQKKEAEKGAGDVSVSQPIPGGQPKPKTNIMPPPPMAPSLKKETSVTLPVGHANPTVHLPIAKSTGRLVKVSALPKPITKSSSILIKSSNDPNDNGDGPDHCVLCGQFKHLDEEGYCNNCGDPEND
jgi:hypothetical protein